MVIDNKFFESFSMIVGPNIQYYHLANQTYFDKSTRFRYLYHYILQHSIQPLKICEWEFD